MDSVNLSRDIFKKNLQEAAIITHDFTRTIVTTQLPDAIAYTILYGCSYDGNPLIDDEKNFPEDYDQELITTTSAEHVTNLLWRDGFVPEWINVTVSHEDGKFTYILLECCGRFTGMEKHLYHRGGGIPPFNPQVAMPGLDYDLETDGKFPLRQRYNK